MSTVPCMDPAVVHVFRTRKHEWRDEFQNQDSATELHLGARNLYHDYFMEGVDVKGCPAQLSQQNVRSRKNKQPSWHIRVTQKTFANCYLGYSILALKTYGIKLAFRQQAACLPVTFEAWCKIRESWFFIYKGASICNNGSWGATRLIRNYPYFIFTFSLFWVNEQPALSLFFTAALSWKPIWTY